MKTYKITYFDYNSDLYTVALEGKNIEDVKNWFSTLFYSQGIIQVKEQSK